MRLRRAAAVLILGIAARVAFAQTTDCARLELDTAEKRIALTERISNLDVEALRQAQSGVACFKDTQYAELGWASGAYFDARPREYLENISARSGNDVSLLDALIFVPESVRRNPAVQLAVYTRRGSLLDANADLIDPFKHKHIVEVFWRGIDNRIGVLTEPLPEPDTLIEPLVGLEINLKRWRRLPTASDTMAFEDMASMAHWYSAAWHFAPGNKLYVVLSGYRFVQGPDDAAPTGLQADAGWIEVVDEKLPRARIEKLGPVNPVLASGRIPPEDAAALCAAGVKQLEDAFELDHERLQAALDDHIAKNPQTSLAKPLLDAFNEAGYKVKKYGVLTAPRATQVSRNSSSDP